MPEFFTERYQSGLGLADLKAEARRLALAVADLRQQGESIDFVEMTFLPGDEGVFARFVSASEQLVERAHQDASLRFDRIVMTEPVEIDLRTDDRVAATERLGEPS